jgi:hypothetical protein
MGFEQGPWSKVLQDQIYDIKNGVWLTQGCFQELNLSVAQSLSGCWLKNRFLLFSTSGLTIK